MATWGISLGSYLQFQVDLCSLVTIHVPPKTIKHLHHPPSTSKWGLAWTSLVCQCQAWPGETKPSGFSVFGWAELVAPYDWCQKTGTRTARYLNHSAELLVVLFSFHLRVFKHSRILKNKTPPGCQISAPNFCFWWIFRGSNFTPDWRIQVHYLCWGLNPRYFHQLDPIRPSWSRWW